MPPGKWRKFCRSPVPCSFDSLTPPWFKVGLPFFGSFKDTHVHREST